MACLGNGGKRFYKQLLDITWQSQVKFLISDLSLAKKSDCLKVSYQSYLLIELMLIVFISCHCLAVFASCFSLHSQSRLHCGIIPDIFK